MIFDKATAIRAGLAFTVFAIAMLSIIMALASPARAHESWISRGNLKNPAGEWCCGDGDCGIMVGGSAVAMTGGYEIDADFAIESAEGPPLIEHYREFWPYREAQPSPDGAFYRCKRLDGSPRCKFVPPSGS